MVCMGVGEEDRVNVRDVLAERLGAEIRRGVNKDMTPFVLNQQGGSSPLVLWII
jgi:hypothetical protein